MIVLDASAAVELLTNGPLAARLRFELENHGEPVIVPHLLDIEAASAIRNLLSGQRIDPHRSEQMLRDLEDLPAVRCAQTPLLDRVWQLRQNFTPYDAVYVALAEEADALLLTTNSKLSKGHRAQVLVISPSKQR